LDNFATMRSRQLAAVAPAIASGPALKIKRAGERRHEPWRSSERSRHTLSPLDHSIALDP
jgi:hypothetical protein